MKMFNGTLVMQKNNSSTNDGVVGLRDITIVCLYKHTSNSTELSRRVTGLRDGSGFLLGISMFISCMTLLQN